MLLFTYQLSYKKEKKKHIHSLDRTEVLHLVHSLTMHSCMKRFQKVVMEGNEKSHMWHPSGSSLPHRKGQQEETSHFHPLRTNSVAWQLKWCCMCEQKRTPETNSSTEANCWRKHKQYTHTHIHTNTLFAGHGILKPSLIKDTIKTTNTGHQ